MSLRALPPVLVAFAASACIFGGGDDELQNGTWETGEVTVDSNECGLDPVITEVEIPTDFYLFREFDGTYTIAPFEDPEDDDLDEIECEENVLEEIIECDRETYTAPLPPTSGLNVRNQLSATVDGNKRLTMSMATRVACAGDRGSTGCKIAKSKLELKDGFPCELVQTFEATWVSDELGPLDPQAALE